MTKCNYSSQKPLVTTGIWTRDLWFRSLTIRPADRLMMFMQKFLLCGNKTCNLLRNRRVIGTLHQIGS
jgi:hypothetical protein